MTELVDLVDAAGTVVRPGVARDDQERHDGAYLQIIVAVLLDGSGRALVNQRGPGKMIAPGRFNHVCGAVRSGEDPEQAALREAVEETGLAVERLTLLRHGINSYGRYCYLYAGLVDGEPDASRTRPAEVGWVGYLSAEELAQVRRQGQASFVDDFFEDMAAARAHLLGPEPAPPVRHSSAAVDRVAPWQTEAADRT
ncbi:NUDIX domain-containing protein [Catellatospora sichuanensis]|uniref:NUDIX domain-containing protein n=1 Tax=Catellatospora sichuanensis TaxID=1969805 RepID=UPI0011821830|nr:NUDIX domain-containing protein [Catellatospora sichuanensis]